jgi:hypothetical protein
MAEFKDREPIEILPYENAETWFVRARAILKEKEA